MASHVSPPDLLRARARRALVVLGVLLLAASCRSTRPNLPSPPPPAPLPPPAAPVFPEEGSAQHGLASWYGADFADLPTASGEIFRPERLSAAHRTLPLGTVIDVTNDRNGKTVRVTVNDRGPFVSKRIVDLSRAAARRIGLVDGVVPVTIRVVKLGDGKVR